MQYFQCILPTYFVKWRPPPRVKKKRNLLGPQEYRCSSHPEFQTVFQNHKYGQWEISWVPKQLFKNKKLPLQHKKIQRQMPRKEQGVEQSAHLRVERRKELQSVGGGAKRSATTTTTTEGDRKQQLVHSLISSFWNCRKIPEYLAWLGTNNSVFFGIAKNSGKCLHAMPKIWKKKL